MGTNGRRRPPRPDIQMVTPSPSDAEAAAIAAALERFLVETGPTSRSARPQSRWQQAALAEGVGKDLESRSSWGGRSGWPRG